MLIAANGIKSINKSILIERTIGSSATKLPGFRSRMEQKKIPEFTIKRNDVFQIPLSCFDFITFWYEASIRAYPAMPEISARFCKSSFIGR